MSQIRTGQKDRLVNDFISTIILRAENQTRHVNAKMDHLQTHQWKRLLEIQEIQGDVLQILQSQQIRDVSPPYTSNILSHPRTHTHTQEKIDTHEYVDSLNSDSSSIHTDPKSISSREWTGEIFPDDHARLIIRSHFNKSNKREDEFIFAHWHTDGDNFTGSVVDAKLIWTRGCVPIPTTYINQKNTHMNTHMNEGMRLEGLDIGERLLESMEYTLSLSDASATMDDLFSGEGTITLRNDFEVEGMHMHGTFHYIYTFDSRTYSDVGD